MSLIDSHIVPALSRFDVSKQCFTSLVLSAVFTIMRLMPPAVADATSSASSVELRDCLLRLTRALLPWMISSYGSIRSMVQQAVSASASAGCKAVFGWRSTNTCLVAGHGIAAGI